MTTLNLRKVAVFVAALAAITASATPAETIEGRLDIIWGDPAPEETPGAELEFFLSSSEGHITQLWIEEELLSVSGGLVNLNGQWVEVALFPIGVFPELDAQGIRAALSLAKIAAPGELVGDEEPEGGVLGSKPWVSILCKFADKPAEPENLGYFQGMYDNAPGRLDHYWREVSYDNIDVVGSLAVDWVVLPQNHTFYVPNPGSGTSANLSLLFDDCTAAADPFVDFSNGGTGGYEGINLMFNDLLDCCAWGGGRFATLDGVSKTWRTTWNPPWAFAQEGVIAHEMGHGFGLPHANNSDGDSNPYDSPWDVMSSATGYSVDDPVYGNLGKHVTTYHKQQLGWMASEETLVVDSEGIITVHVEPLGSAVVSDYRMIRIPIGGSNNHYYTVEVRESVGQYEGDLPGGPGDKKVIIHEVLTSRSEPAWVLDLDDPPADYADTEGVMWRVGEVFSDPANEIEITVVAETGSGFDVRVALGQALFIDGFESGDTSAWDATVE